MGDDYLVRSGAKELLARAVASLLEIHPANPVRFLAHRFDTKASTVDRSVWLLQACPLNSAAYQDALFQAFRWLSLGSSPTAEPSLIENLGISVVSAIPRASYELVLAKLSADFPIHVKDRALDKLRGLAGVEVDKDVLINEFQRGVRVCSLLEELFDVVDELFYAIDKGCFGEIKLAVVLSALENAAQQRAPHDLDGSALALLKHHLRSRHEIPGLVAAATQDTSSGDGGSNVIGPIPSTADDTHRSLRLVDLQEIVFHAVFTP